MGAKVGKGIGATLSEGLEARLGDSKG